MGQGESEEVGREGGMNDWVGVGVSEWGRERVRR